MTWQTLLVRDPELAGIARACRAARQQGADWHDFHREHHTQIIILAGRMPTPALRSEAVQTIYEHLFTVWVEALDGPPAALPWDSRPAYEVPV